MGGCISDAKRGVMYTRVNSMAYLVWLKLYAIYCYLVPLEVLSGPLMVACALTVAPSFVPAFADETRVAPQSARFC